MSPPPLFDYKTLALHRHRAALLLEEDDVLLSEMAGRLIDRLADIKRTFSHVLTMGAWGVVSKGLSPWKPQQVSYVSTLPLAAGEKVMQENFLGAPLIELPEGDMIGQDEVLKFPPHSFDCILSCLHLHWIHDLPGMLTQIRQTLKPDGLFMAVLWGGETLVELRAAMMAADIQQLGGACPHISPLLSVYDAAALMQRAGFALPVVDTERLALTYKDLKGLYRDLRLMGETAAFQERAMPYLGPRYWAEVEQQYAARVEGRFSATFQAVYLTGWGPDASQPKALPRGSGEISLQDILS